MAPEKKPTAPSAPTGEPGMRRGASTSSKEGTPGALRRDQAKPGSKPGSQQSTPQALRKEGTPRARRSSKEITGQAEKKAAPPPPSKAPEPPKPALTEEELELFKATTGALDKLIEQGKEVASELKEAVEMELPRLAARGRRKSKDLEEQAMDLLGNHLERVFKLIDVSGDGNLDEGELKAAFELAGRPTTDEAIKKAIKELDTDGDGVISLEEFKAIAWQTSVQ